MTPVGASARTATVFGGRLIGDGVGTPKSSKLLKSPVKMFTYQVRGQRVKIAGRRHVLRFCCNLGRNA